MLQKNFDILITCLSILHNYFDGLKLFSDLYLVKFLDISAKSFFPCIYNIRNILYSLIDNWWHEKIYLLLIILTNVNINKYIKTVSLFFSNSYLIFESKIDAMWTSQNF